MGESVEKETELNNYGLKSGTSMLKRAKWPAIIFAGIFLIFILTRIATLMSFPIFNDEAIYIEYSQIIHSNFGTYKFISLNNQFKDWKPPLQYWIGSFFLNFSSDPLLATRLASFFISILGFLGIFFLVLKLYGTKPALWAAFLYAICPPILMYNNQFVTETFVFSLASIYYLFLVLWIKAKNGGYQYLALATIFGLALYLSKQSGQIFIYLSILLPLIGATGGEEAENLEEKNNLILKKTGWTLGVIAASYALFHLIIPGQLFANEAAFTDRWLMSLKDMYLFPVGDWANNLISVYHYYFSYYTLATIPLTLYFIGRSFTKKDIVGIVVSLCFLGSSAAIIFLLKGFNEYIYNTAAVIFLIIMLAKLASELCDTLKDAKKIKSLKTGAKAVLIIILALILFVISSWIYQDVLMKVSPIKYLERGTDWMVGDYLTGWSTGFGINQALDFIRSQKEGGVVMPDPQWGNPRDALLVYRQTYPSNISLAPMIYIFKPIQVDQLNKFKNRFVIFSGYPGDSARQEWQNYVYKFFCKNKFEFKEYDQQFPIVVCEF